MNLPPSRRGSYPILKSLHICGRRCDKGWPNHHSRTFDGSPVMSRRHIARCGNNGARSHADRLLANAAAHANSRDPDLKLLVGYVSADFHEHSVAYFSSSILRAHDHDRFEIVCFDNTEHTDGVTERLKQYANRWHRIARMTDDAVAQLIRREQIDILVDLGGHTADNRLPVFARKPAPVQLTYLGYPDTTGMCAMDYRITDAIADPPGQTERFHSEQLISLPRG